MPTRSPLDLDRATMQAIGRRVADVVAAHLAGLRDQPTRRLLSREAADRQIIGPAPAEGQDFDSLLAFLTREVFPFHTREPHPGFMAYVQSCSSFPAVAGDWLATGFNFFAGVWSVAPGPNALELAVLDWFRDWLGMPIGTGGLLTTGGSAATLTAVIAARQRLVAGEASRIASAVLYASEQSHSSVTRAAWIAGLPHEHVRALPVDGEFRIRLGPLQAALAEDRAGGLLPMMIVANAGTTNTGAVDPMPALADLAERERVWLHVDAAYGGFAALTGRGRRLLDGIGRADSVTLDPHKWLFVPFECGCLLARDPARLKETYKIIPDYLKDIEARGEEVNFADYGEQLTRYARGVKVWMMVNYFGTRVIADAIEESIARAEHAERLIRDRPELELLSAASLGIVCFRAHPKGLDDPLALDRLNERINQQINANARYFISSTRICGAFSLRICTPGFRTTREDVEGLVEEIGSVLRTEC